MKTTLSLPRVAFMAVVLGTASVTAGFAQTTNAPSATPPTTSTKSFRHHHHLAVLTDAERAELKKARQEALAANPNLQTQKTDLKQQFKTLVANKATPDQFKALHPQASAFRQQLRSAELLIDPNLAPIFAKIDAAKHGHHHAA